MWKWKRERKEEKEDGGFREKEEMLNERKNQRQEKDD